VLWRLAVTSSEEVVDRDLALAIGRDSTHYGAVREP
jgi:hypothetical protein